MNHRMQLDLDHIRYLRALVEGDQFAAGRLREPSGLQAGTIYDLIQASRIWEIFASVDPCTAQLPTEQLAALRRRLTWNARQRQQIDAAQLELWEVWRRHELPVIWLKGDVYGQLYWGQVGRRHQFDMDMLVPRQRLAEALQVLATIGFYRKRQSVLGQRRSLFWHHAISLYRDNIELDLHWSIAIVRFTALIIGASGNECGAWSYPAVRCKLYPPVIRWRTTDQRLP